MKSFIRVSLIAFFMLLIFGPSLSWGQVSFMDFLKDQHIGKSAPDFTLPTLDGKSLNLTKYRDGKQAIIFFWATWCPHCRAELKKLNENIAQIEKQDIKLILVDIGEDKGEVSRYIQQYDIQATIVLDQESSLADPYGIIGVPTFFFINREGIIKAVTHVMPENYQEIFSKS